MQYLHNQFVSILATISHTWKHDQQKHISSKLASAWGIHWLVTILLPPVTKFLSLAHRLLKSSNLDKASPKTQDLGVSKNRGGPPKWMVYNGKPYFQMDDSGGKNPLFSETPQLHGPFLKASTFPWLPLLGVESIEAGIRPQVGWGRSNRPTWNVIFYSFGQRRTMKYEVETTCFPTKYVIPISLNGWPIAMMHWHPVRVSLSRRVATISTCEPPRKRGVEHWKN